MTEHASQLTFVLYLFFVFCFLFITDTPSERNELLPLSLGQPSMLKKRTFCQCAIALIVNVLFLTEIDQFSFSFEVIIMLVPSL